MRNRMATNIVWVSESDYHTSYICTRYVRYNCFTIATAAAAVVVGGCCRYALMMLMMKLMLVKTMTTMTMLMSMMMTAKMMNMMSEDRADYIENVTRLVQC